MKSNKKVMVGLSGGVDSSVAAALLLEDGYEVIGMTMKLWQSEAEEESENGCCSLSAVEDARRIAEKLGIPFYVMNFKDEFKEKVIEYFKAEYLMGKTPNPCIACNKFIKFEDLLKKATSMDINYIATGHYAKIEKNNNGIYFMRKSDDNKKDQTYVLYNMNQNQLSRILMPLGNYEKTKVREIAKKLGFSVADKKDSQEICFIKDNNYAKYIVENTNINIKPGNFVNKYGEVLGKHKGIIHYTIGQRKGLGVSFGKPMYVTEIDFKNNIVVLGENEDLFKKELIVKDINSLQENNFKEEIKIEAKIRYSAIPSKAKIIPIKNGELKVMFEEGQRAITPGQSIVFYKEDFVLGGGVISHLV